MAGVFVDASLATIREVVDRCHLDWVQLHGDESPEFCQSLSRDNVKVMKALRVRTKEDVERAQDYATDAILLDAYHPEQFGGTGLAFDWNLIQPTGKRIFLAGGLNPDNAAAAVELGVYGIDLCSGIESEPGRKDHEKMKQLFEEDQKSGKLSDYIEIVYDQALLTEGSPIKNPLKFTKLVSELMVGAEV